ncbi:helix-turn-helix domain-containing protein [Halobacterium jilantaiense]|uniref:Predicted DNA binding protein, contains HTH domain n=1 Tax=Halobacterium jilantaiense TaxID=355548 RepID=A0A1I0PF43_9EURY|nr:helix-turn-helix domain-containing protein [Halobacterium jilantaiense]SEW12950.1 Predicted DNA binding protein, contains HTH domain [Halobacterium jilantaiense]
MATVVEFRSPADAFPLGTVFENLPGATVELERLVPQESFVVPYFWVRGADADDIEAAFESHSGVNSVVLVDSVDGEFLLRAAWAREYVGVLSALAETNLSVLAATGTASGWAFEVRGETRADVSAFRAYCQDNDIPIEITGVHALLAVRGEGYELTDTQREALVLAYERGYFDSPRRASSADIAAELGISQQSLSSRLRRGQRRLVGATLVDGD